MLIRPKPSDNIDNPHSLAENKTAERRSGWFA